MNKALRTGIIALLSLLFSINVWSQTVVFGPETFGTGTSTPSGWSKSSGWVIESSASSSGYSSPTASGASNARIDNGTTVTASQYLQTPVINFSGYTAGSLVFGTRRSSTSFTSSLYIEVSKDNGTTWSAYTTTLAASSFASGAWNKQTLSLGTSIDNASQVIIRFSLTNVGSGSSNLRLDDIQLSGTGCTGSPTAGTISPAGPITLCSGYAATDLTISGNSPTTATVQWQLSTTSSSSGFTDISGATSATFSIPTGLAAGNRWYRANVTCGGTTVSSTPVAVTISSNTASVITPTSISSCVGVQTSLTVSNAGGGSFSAFSGTATGTTMNFVSSGPPANYYVTAGSTAGTGNFTFTNGSGCQTVLPVTVNANPVNNTTTTAICNGGTSLTTKTLSGTGGDTWAVQSGGGSLSGTTATSGTYTPASTGTKTIRYSVAATGCYADQSFTVNAAPVISPASPSVCASSSTPITVTNAGGGSFGSVTGTSSGTTLGFVSTGSYNLNASSTAGTANATFTVNGCTANLAATVAAQPGNPGSITGSASVCQSTSGNSYSIATVSGATSYTWSYSGTGATITGSTNSITIAYSATATSGTLSVWGVNGSCQSATPATLPITVNSAPAQPSVITGPNPVCASTSGLNYSVVNVSGVSYTWTVNGSGWSIPTPSTTNSVLVTSGSSANGTVNVTASQNGCNSPVRTLSGITVSSPSDPDVVISAATSNICAGVAQTFIATPTNGGSSPTYQWSINGGAPVTAASPYSTTLNEGDIITAKMTVSADACATTSTAVSNMLFAKKLSYSPSTVFTETLGAPSGTTNLSGYSGFTNGQGLTFSGTVYSGTTYPDIRISNASNTAGGAGSGGGNFFFTTNGTAGGPISLTISGINTTNAYPNDLSFWLYKSNAANNGIFGENYFTLDVSTDGTNYYPLHYTAIASTQGQTWNLITINNALPKASNVRLRFTNNSGVQPRIDDIKLTKYSSADASVSASGPTSFCQGGTVTLTAAPTAGSGLTYGWSDGSTSTAITKNTSATYTVTVTDAFTCTSTASQVVTVNANPTTSPTVGSSTICNGSSTTLNANATAGSGSITSYNWSTGLGNVASGSISPASATTYDLTVTNSNGCTATGSTSISVNDKPTVNPTAASGTICNGSGTTLNANATAGSGTISSYYWSTGLGNVASGTVNPILTTIYNVTVTNSNSCTASGSVTVTVNTCGINTWLGNNTNWHDDTNWSNGHWPNNCAEDVLVPNTSIQPTVSSSTAVHDIEVQGGAIITVVTGGGVQVCGTVKGSSTATAAQFTGAGRVTLVGSGLQQLQNKLSFSTLRLTNTAGATLASGAQVDVFTAVELETGTLNTTAGTLRFRSTGSSSYAVLDNFSSGFSGSLTGNVTAERYYDAAGAAKNQHLMGSPITATPLSAFGASGTPGYIIPTSNCDELNSANNTPWGTVFSYDESHGATCAQAGWKVETAGTASATNGFSVYKTTSGVITVSGAPNLAGSYQATNLSNTGGWQNYTLQGRSVDAGWHIVANPYLSDLDISGNQAGFDPVKMVWNTTGPYAGSYQPATVVAPFQAFMVRKSTNGNANYTINASQRTRSGSPSFQKQANDHELTITAKNNSSNLLDATTIAFNADASANFDEGFDAVKSGGALTRHTLYTTMAGNQSWLCQNVVKDIETTNSIPLNMEPGVNGSYTFSFDGVNSFDPTSYIMLEDKQLNVWHDVRSGAYTFNANATDNWNRFVLHFTPAAKFATTDATCQAQGQLNITQAGSATWNYTIANSNNVTVATGTLNSNNAVISSLPAGVYTVTLVDNNNYTVVKNIQVNGVTPVNASMQASSQVAETGEDVTFTSTTVNAVTTTWNFGDGSSAQSSVATHQYATEGVYTVSLTVTNAAGCSSTTSQTVTVTAKTATGIDAVENSGLRMWSNADRVFVDFSNLKQVEATIDIYNILGQKLSSEKFGKSSIYSRTLSNLDAGYVLMSVKNNGEVITRKLFISAAK